MSIAVQFPDGHVRDLPGQLRQIDDPADPSGSAIFEQIPLNCDARWYFIRVGNGWFAHPRSGHVATFRQPVEEWWRPIAIMADDDDGAPDRWESAA